MNSTLTRPSVEPTTDTSGAFSLRHLGEAFRRLSALSARGVGVSEILEKTPLPGASADQRLIVALMLRALYWRALRTGRAPAGIKNTRRDLERTLRYLDRQITPLAEAAHPGSARDLALPRIRPMAIDRFGAEIDVREGPEILRVLTHDGRERHDVLAVAVHILGDALPPMSVTVTLPSKWQPSVLAMRTLCHTISVTHAAHCWPGCEQTD